MSKPSIIALYSKSFRRAISVFKSSAGLFLLWQLPEVSVDWIDRYFQSEFEKEPWLGALIVIPYFILGSALGSTLCVLTARHIDEKISTPKLTWIWNELCRRKFLYLKVALLTGLLFVVGMPVILPAVYFMTVYLFAPVLATYAAPNLSAFSVLNQSKTLVRTAPLPIALFTCFFLALGIAFFLLQERMDAWLVARLGMPEYMGWLVDTLFSLASGVTINLGIYGLFRTLDETKNSPALPN